MGAPKNIAKGQQSEGTTLPPGQGPKIQKPVTWSDRQCTEYLNKFSTIWNALALTPEKYGNTGKETQLNLQSFSLHPRTTPHKIKSNKKALFKNNYQSCKLSSREASKGWELPPDSIYLGKKKKKSAAENGRPDLCKATCVSGSWRACRY